MYVVSRDTYKNQWDWKIKRCKREGRKEGGGFRMGNAGIPVVDSFRYLAKLIQYCKL